MNQLVPLPVVLPLLAAGVKLTLGARAPRVQRMTSVGGLAVVLAVSLVLLVEADRMGPQTVQLGGWPPPVGITLVADRLSALMLTVSSAVTLFVFWYSLGQGMADRDDVTPLAVYRPTYLVLVAGVSDTFLAGDLFNLYVGFEIMLTASYVLLTLGGTTARVRAGATYVVMSVLSSLLFLITIALVYAAAGTVNLAELAGVFDELPLGVRTIAQILLLTTFGVKAAVFPLAAWLPDSYPTAPAPVTAVFAGLLTKVGVYCVLRVQTLLFPGDRLSEPLMLVALLSMVVGMFGAVAQSDLKRLLSFILISHIGYMIFGIALASVEGLSGAIFYVAHHITVQTTLFLVAGLVERRGGTTDLHRLGGLARLSPILGALFFVPAMNLSGIPPLSGFLGKLGLLRAGAIDGGSWAYLLIAGASATSLLTLYAVVKAWNLAFWRAAPPELTRVGAVLESAEGDEAEDAEERPDVGGHPATGTAASGRSEGAAGAAPLVPSPALSGAPHPRRPSPTDGSGSTAIDVPRRRRGTAVSLSGRSVTTSAELPRSMLLSTLALVLLGLAYTVLAGPMIGLTQRSADELLDRKPYIEAVVGG